MQHGKPRTDRCPKICQQAPPPRVRARLQHCFLQGTSEDSSSSPATVRSWSTHIPASGNRLQDPRKTNVYDSDFFDSPDPRGYASSSVATAATVVVPTIAKSVGMGEARPPGFAKYSSTSVSESELVELMSSAVVKSVGGARLDAIAESAHSRREVS